MYTVWTFYDILASRFYICVCVRIFMQIIMADFECLTKGGRKNEEIE